MRRDAYDLVVDDWIVDCSSSLMSLSGRAWPELTRSSGGFGFAFFGDSRFIAVYAVVSGEIIYIDVATVLALIAFLGTVAFAYFIEKGGMPWRKT